MATIQYVTLGLVTVSAFYVALTAVATLRFSRGDPQSAIRAQRPGDNSKSPFTPPVTILKPVCGVDAEADENFRSFLEQDYPEFQIIFGALDENDPALEVARRVTARKGEWENGRVGETASPIPPLSHSPTLDVVVAGCSRTIGANLKVSNLHNMMEHARHDLFVIADSDMRVTPNYLREIIAPFADEKVGLVTCPYRGAMPREATWWQRIVIALQALGITTEFMPSMMVAHIFGMRGFAFGSTIAIRRSVLEEIGASPERESKDGFEALKDHLADDYQLGQRVKRLGRKVVLSRYLVDNVLSPEPFAEMLKRRLRWARTVKVCQRAGHLGSFVTHLLPLAMLNLIAWRGASLAWQTFVGALLLRLIVTIANNGRYFDDRVIARYSWLTPINDALSFVIWCWSLVPGPIVWRGRRFRLTRDGVLW